MLATEGQGHPEGYPPAWSRLDMHLANFREIPKGEVRRILIPRTPVYKDHKKGRDP
jgi:hypothetical protein